MTNPAAKTTTTDMSVEELEQHISSLRHEIEELRMENTVMWSARIPKVLREQVRSLQGGQSTQDVTVEALNLWMENRHYEIEPHTVGRESAQDLIDRIFTSISEWADSDH